MKKLVLLILLIPLVSCKQMTQLSCAPEIDYWAKLSIDYYEKAPLSEIVSLPLTRQRAIYRGLSGEKKIEIWKHKLQVVSNQGILKEQELIAFRDFICSLTPDIFDDADQREKFQIEGREWELRMKHDFGWTEEKLFRFAHIWMTDEELADAVLLDDTYTKGGGESTGRDCECLYDIYCIRRAYNECSTNVGCDIVSGCGLVGNSNCKGICL